METYKTGEAPLLLNGATATGAGESLKLPLTYSKYSWRVNPVGSITAMTVVLQGSLDGEIWDNLDSNNNVAGGLRSVVDIPIKYVRANVTVWTPSGSGSPSAAVSVRLCPSL